MVSRAMPALALMALVLLAASMSACDEALPTPTPAPTAAPMATPTAMPPPAPTATPVPTATLASALEPGTGLLEKLSLIPAQFIDEGVWYGDMGRAWEMAGLQAPRSRVDIVQSDSVRDAYNEARRGIVMAPGFLGGLRSEPKWEEVFGFNGYECLGKDAAYRSPICINDLALLLNGGDSPEQGRLREEWL